MTRFFASLVAVASVAAACISSAAAAGLSSTVASTDSLRIGDDFLVALEANDGGARLAIYNSDKSKQLWASVAGDAFVRVGVSPPDLEHFYYGFAVTNPEFTSQSSDQSITAFARDDATGAVTLSGVLSLLPANASTAVDIPYTLQLAPVSGKSLSFTLDVDATVSKTAGVNRLVLEASADADEEFYGFGQQFPLQLNAKGSRVPILVNEQGAGRGLQPLTQLLNAFNNHSGGDIHQTYAPIPHFQTSKLRQLFLDNSEYAVFDLTKATTTRIELAATQLRGQLSYGNSPLELIESFTSVTGRQRKLPAWISSGAIVGTQGGRAFIESVHEKLKQVGTPIAAFWLQDWVGNRVAPWGKALWWNWEVDDVRYPQWGEFVANLKQQNVRTMTYLNPHAGDIKGIKTEPAPKRFLFQEMVANGFDVKDHNGNTQLSYQNAAMLDLSNPNARQWLKELIKTNILANGVSGYMCDFGEALQLDAKIFQGDAAAFHNKYPEEWAKVNHEAVEELGMQDDVVFFMRAGFTRSPQYTPLFWLGDQLQSWDEYDGLKNSVLAATVGGFSGIALTHPDIGGYNNIDNALLPVKYRRTKELFLRSAEFAAFTAAYRTHDGSSREGSWQFDSDAETLELFARNAKIFVAWDFYRQQLMEQVAAKGYPLVRHLYLHYPEDAMARNVKYQFLVGTELLVAPLVDEGKTEVTLYLPKGKWVHVWTDKVYEGNQSITVAVPFGYTAVFYPVGSSVGKQFVANLDAANLRGDASSSGSGHGSGGDGGGHQNCPGS